MKIEKIELKNYYSFLGDNNCNPTLTAYLPYNMPEMGRQNDKRPCMLVCPGGGYGMCSEREAEPIALHFLPEGFNAFVLNYSVAPNRFPTQLREVAAAMDLIYKNADKWNCDTEKIAIIGFSAGGHLAAHYSTCFDIPEVREVFPDSHSVNASVLSYPVITADETNAHIGSFQNLLGHTPDVTETDKFSCERNVNEKTPPAFLWHTAEDSGVPVENSLLYATALSKYKIPFELHIYPYGWHGLSTVDHTTNGELPENIISAKNWLSDVKRWLKMTFNY
ncbi:MAG: alpha/beta hydrolase [Clostridia bacterium]|nr:alpha/beta hydrolase [Clostridia bacterium]